MAGLARLSRTILAAAGVLAMAVVTILAAIYIADHQGKEGPTGRQSCLNEAGIEHKVIILHGQVTPTNTEGSRCDRLTILNLDDKTRLIAFGRHDNHISYDGVAEHLLGEGRGMTVTLGSTGSYLFHDHLDSTVRGSFTVR